MAIKTLNFLVKQFSNYYRDHGNAILPPSQFENREFAFFWFSREGALRHTSFANLEELIQFMGREGPAHTFHSAAYYEKPDAPQMPLKEWRGTDLVFDIDADHFDLPCQKQHDIWWCLECGHRDHGRRPDLCPKCNASRLDELKWMCDECLAKSKEEAIKIIENFLVPDFGISRSEIMIVFSGHRGYHVHSYTSEILSLGSQARREIVDYISGTGIDFRSHGFVDNAYGVPKGPDPHSPGWERKIAQGIRFLFQNPSQLQKIPGLRANQARILQEEAKTISEHLMEEPARYITPKGVGRKTWSTIAQYVLESTSAIVDEPVTTDIHRLIRLPGSLHGKTGFIVKKVELSALADFDPFRHAQTFQGTITVSIKDSPAFTLGSVHYPPMREIKKELPLSAAMLLLCKGVAEIT